MEWVRLVSEGGTGLEEIGGSGINNGSGSSSPVVLFHKVLILDAGGGLGCLSGSAIAFGNTVIHVIHFHLRKKKRVTILGSGS